MFSPNDFVTDLDAREIPQATSTLFFFTMNTKDEIQLNEIQVQHAVHTIGSHRGYIYHR